MNYNCIRKKGPFGFQCLIATPNFITSNLYNLFWWRNVLPILCYNLLLLFVILYNSVELNVIHVKPFLIFVFYLLIFLRSYNIIQFILSVWPSGLCQKSSAYGLFLLVLFRVVSRDDWHVRMAVSDHGNALRPGIFDAPLTLRRLQDFSHPFRG